MSIGVPTQTAAGGYVIPIVDYLGKKANIPDWYPGGGLPPSPLVTATIVDRGMEKLPAGCDVPRALATAGEAIVRTGSQFDPNGDVGTNTEVAYYAPDVGMVCNVQSEHTTEYFVIDPAAKLVAVETYHAITSLVRLSRKVRRRASARRCGCPRVRCRRRALRLGAAAPARDDPSGVTAVRQALDEERTVRNIERKAPSRPKFVANVAIENQIGKDRGRRRSLRRRRAR